MTKKRDDAYYASEVNKWDRLASQADIESLRLKDGEDFYSYARTTTLLRGLKVEEFLADLKDKQTLECGCGVGHTAALLAKSGANVTAYDLSPKSVETTRLRAQVSGIEDHLHLFAVAKGEELPFADESFDVIFGRAILHHIDPNRGSSEVYRVLRRGGRAVFLEPLGTNPVISFVRDHVWYPDKNPVGDDSPLVYDEIRKWGEGYSQFRYQEVQLFGALERFLGFSRNFDLGPIHSFDRVLLKNVPFLRRYCRAVVLFMIK